MQPNEPTTSTPPAEALFLTTEAPPAPLLSALQQHGLQPRLLGTPELLLAARMSIPNPRLIILDATEDFQARFDLYRQLRQTSAFAALPVLFVIQSRQSNEALDACNLRNNDYVVQPIDPTVLREKLRRLCTPKTDQPQSNTDALPIGELISRRFEVRRSLGEGGMGQVYLVHDLQKDTELALKIIFKDDSDDENNAARRFQKEIEALLTLDHPNIIKMYDYGQHNDFSYYTMDYLPHGCLADVLEAKGALPYQQALQVLIPLASALFHAHKQGILHRDLKPENIMFKKGGAPVLTDFGLALQIEKAQTRLTKKGHIIGTAYYMSPEQITKPHELDARCDIYSLGALLFEMLTGEPPFPGGNPFIILQQILTRPTPSAKERHDAIPQAVSDFCQKAMARNKDDRFPNAAVMVQAAALLLAGKAPASA